jgi:hypothetical protein
LGVFSLKTLLNNKYLSKKNNMRINDACQYTQDKLTEKMKWEIRDESHIDTGEMLYYTFIKVSYDQTGKIDIRIESTDYFKFVEAARVESGRTPMLELLLNSSEFADCKRIILAAIAEEKKEEIKKELLK